VTPVSPGLPWRRLGILAILAVLAAAAAILAVGTGPRPAPPFGPAANGLVAYTFDMDIYGRNLATGEQHLLVGGDGIDVAPLFSPDGSKLGWLRLDPVTFGYSNEKATIYVADADGSSPRAVFGPERIEDAAWSPSGDEIAVRVAGFFDITIVEVGDGTSRPLGLGLRIDGFLKWRPPDGQELVFRASPNRGFYAVRPDGSGLRRITPEGETVPLNGPIDLSPDGRFLVYMNFDLPFDIRVVDLETGLERPFGTNLPVPEESPGQGPIHAGGMSLSTDGTKVVFGRYWDERDGQINHQIWVASIDGDGSDAVPISPVVRSQSGHDPFLVTTSPDGTRIVVHRVDSTDTWIYDFSGRSRETVDWGDIWDFSWQRLAP
jgi:Tol biopolymer transport system component